MKFVMNINQRDMNLDDVNIVPSILFNDIFSIIEKHLDNHVSMAVITKNWREITIALHPLPGKTFDFIKKQCEPVMAEINNKYECESGVQAYMRHWASTNVEIYITVRGT